MSASFFGGARWLGAVLLMATLSGCGGSPTAPGEVITNVSGTWVSTDGRYRWTLAQADLMVTGTHLDTRTASVTPIDGEIVGRHFEFRVVTGETLITFLDPPQLVERGWQAQANVDGAHMNGSISTFGSGFRESIIEITMQRVGSSR